MTRQRDYTIDLSEAAGELIPLPYGELIRITGGDHGLFKPEYTYYTSRPMTTREEYDGCIVIDGMNDAQALGTTCLFFLVAFEKSRACIARNSPLGGKNQGCDYILHTEEFIYPLLFPNPSYEYPVPAKFEHNIQRADVAFVQRVEHNRMMRATRINPQWAVDGGTVYRKPEIPPALL